MRAVCLGTCGDGAFSLEDVPVGGQILTGTSFTAVAGYAVGFEGVVLFVAELSFLFDENDAASLEASAGPI